MNLNHYDELVEAVRSLLMQEPGARASALRLLGRLPNQAKAEVELFCAWCGQRIYGDSCVIDHDHPDIK